MIEYFLLFLGWCLITELFKRLIKVSKDIYSEEELSQIEEGANESKKMRSKRMEFITHHTSILHACICFTLTLTMWFKNGQTYDQTNRYDESMVIKVSVSYFVCDTLYGIIYGYLDASMMIHHGLTVGSLGFVLFVDRYSSEMMEALWRAEISNPFILTKEILDMKKYKGPANTLSGVMFMATFLIFRIFLGWEFISIIQTTASYFFMRLMSALLLFVSWFWAWKIYNLAAKELTNTFPTSRIFKGYYSCMKALRPFAPVYYVGAFAFTCNWMVRDYYSQWKAQQHSV